MAAPGGLMSGAAYHGTRGSISAGSRGSVSGPAGGSAPPVAPEGPSGATASTGGFVGGTGSGNTPGFGGGGLASSPNVPKPGSSLDPATGKPYAAGLTREELAQIRAKGADLLDTSNAVGSGSSLADLSGREQAARQLTATAPGTASKELPGGWGSTKPVGAPGTGPDATTSIYNDVTETLDKVGRTAYNLMPQGMKDVLSNSPTSPKTSTTTLAPSGTSGRRGSAAMFLDRLKEEGSALINDPANTGNTTGRRGSAFKTGSTTAESGEKILNTVKGFLGGVVEQANNAIHPAVGTSSRKTSISGATAVAPRTSMPSDEVAGAVPGEHTSGVGALPGSINEKGVAVLPDEKHAVVHAPAQSLPSQENQGMLPGEVSAGAGALPGKSSEAGVAIPPDVKSTEGSSGGLIAGASDTPAPAASHSGPDVAGAAAAGAAAAAAANSNSLSAPPKLSSSGSYTGLAAPLPHTRIFEGAAHGATDLEATPGVITDGATTSTASPDSPTTRVGNERTTSMASVTAIRGGSEGERHEGGSPLAGDSVTAENVVGNVGTGTGAGVLAAQAQSSGSGVGTASSGLTDSEHRPTTQTANTIATETHGTSATEGSSGASSALPESTQTKSLTPGSANDGVGHPSSRDTPGASREPGSYPKADHDGPVHHDRHSSGAAVAGATGATGLAAAGVAEEAKRGQTDVKPNTGVVSAAGAGGNHVTPPSSSAASVTGNGHGDDTNGKSPSHRRKSSSADSGGKKKVGFMNKLKGEIKVIGGKLSNDQEKVEEGERLKHGEPL